MAQPRRIAPRATFMAMDASDRLAIISADLHLASDDLPRHPTDGQRMVLSGYGKQVVEETTKSWPH